MPATGRARSFELGAWQTLQNALGERLVDIAQRRHSGALIDILAPTPMRTGKRIRNLPVGNQLRARPDSKGQDAPFSKASMARAARLPNGSPTDLPRRPTGYHRGKTGTSTLRGVLVSVSRKARRSAFSCCDNMSGEMSSERLGRSMPPRS
jgi:hypothetical protein